MPRKAEIQAEEAAVNSPLRRSTRRTSVNSPAPATVGTRRNSQTQNENTEVKAPKTRRGSLSQENSEKPEVKPATRGRRASTSKEESEPKPEPAKTRGRRASATTEPTPEEAPKAQTVTRRRRSSAAEDPPNPEAVKPVRTRRGSSADKPVEEEPAKKVTRARRNLAKEEEPKEDPIKRTTRSRRNSVDKAEDGESNEKKPATRGRRSSTEVQESDPEAKPVKLTPIKSRRRPSVTENVAGLEPIEELESEIKSRHSSSPVLKEATVTLSRVKPAKPEAKENLNLSVIVESSFTEESQTNKLEEHEGTPRRSPRLNRVKSAEKLGLQSSPKSEKRTSMEATQEQEKEDLPKVEEDAEEKRTEAPSAETSVSEKEKTDKEATPLEAENEKDSELLNEKSSKEDNVSKRLTEPDNCNISIGSDGSFNFHLNTTLATTRNDATENEDLNSSKSSNTSDKENVNMNVVSSPAPKRVITEEKELVLSTLTNNVAAEDRNVVQQEVMVARVSNVFRPRMKENSFMEPMEVDECSTLEDKCEELKTEDLITASTPLAKLGIKDKEIKEKLISKNLLKENDSVDDSFHLQLSNYGDNQGENEEEVKDDIFEEEATKEVASDEDSKSEIEAVEEMPPLKTSEIAEEVAELKADIQIKTDDLSEVEENLLDHNSEVEVTTHSEQKAENLDMNTLKDNIQRSPSFIGIKPDYKESLIKSKSPQDPGSPKTNLSGARNRSKSPSFIYVEMDNQKGTSTSPQPNVVTRRSKSPQIEKPEEKQDAKRRSKSPMLTNQDIEERDTVPNKTPDKVNACALSEETIEKTLESSPKKGTADDTFWNNSLNSENPEAMALTISAVEKAVRRSNTGLEEKSETAQPYEDISDVFQMSQTIEGEEEEASTAGCQLNKDVESATEPPGKLKADLEYSLQESVEVTVSKKMCPSDDYDFHVPSDEEAEETHAPEYDQSTVVNSFMTSSQLVADDSTSVELQTVICTKTTTLHEEGSEDEDMSRTILNDEEDSFADEVQDHEKASSPSPKKKTRNSISKNKEEFEKNDEKLSSPTPKSKSKKRISKGKDFEDPEENISDKKQCENKISKLEDNEKSSNNTDMKDDDKINVPVEKPSSPGPKKTSRDSISKHNEEFEKNADEKSSSPTPESKSKKRISKGKDFEDPEENISEKEKCNNISKLEDNEKSSNNTDMKEDDEINAPVEKPLSPGLKKKTRNSISKKNKELEKNANECDEKSSSPKPETKSKKRISKGKDFEDPEENISDIENDDDRNMEAELMKINDLVEKPSSPGLKKKTRNSISKKNKELEKNADECDEKSSSPTPESKSKKRISKGKDFEDPEENIRDIENDDDRNMEAELMKINDLVEKPSSPGLKKKTRNSISKKTKELEKNADECDEKSSSPTPESKSKKSVSKGKDFEECEKNISDIENEDDDDNMSAETDKTPFSGSPKKKCTSSNNLKDNEEIINNTDMKSPQKKSRVRKYSLKKEIDSFEENLDKTNEEKDNSEDSENQIEIPKKKKVKKRRIVKQDLLENIDTITDINNADVEVDADVQLPKDNSNLIQKTKSNEDTDGIKKLKRKRASKRHSECAEETEVKKKKVKRTKKKPELNPATGEDSSDEETSVKRKEKSPSSKLDEFLSRKLEELQSEEESSSAYDNDEEPNEYVCTMAEEGEEDTPSEDSNAIIDEGESINTTESEYDSQEDNYDENDSFICDEEDHELLSGEEYDLGDEKTKKKKKSRIIQLDNSDEDIISIQKKVKETPVAKKRTRIITVSDSSEPEEDKEANPDEIINLAESVDTDKIQEDAEEEVSIVESKRSVGSLETSFNISGTQSPGQQRTEKRRLSSITIHENINVKEIKDAPLSGRISQIVDSFCTTMHKGEISMNLSIECVVKDEETSADEKNPKKPRASTDSSIEVFENEENIDSEEGTSHKPLRRLSASMDNIESSELKKRARKKRKLSKSMDNLDQIETKTKKKKLQRKKKNLAKKKEETKIPSEEELRVRSFGLINQLLTDLKNRPKRMVRPSTNMNNSWITEVVDVKPSTSAFDKQEQAAYKAGKVHPKDFRSQMLNDPSRVRRVETKTLLKKKGVYK